MNDMVDITPRGIDPTSRGQAFVKGAVFQETEIRQILENPMGLTKEGIEEKVRIWKGSNNGQCKSKYNTMLQRCKNIQPSGTVKEKLSSGREVRYIVLARDKNGIATWKKEDTTYVPEEDKKTKK